MSKQRQERDYVLVLPMLRLPERIRAEAVGTIGHAEPPLSHVEPLWVLPEVNDLVTESLQIDKERRDVHIGLSHRWRQCIDSHQFISGSNPVVRQHQLRKCRREAMLLVSF